MGFGIGAVRWGFGVLGLGLSVYLFQFSVGISRHVGAFWFRVRTLSLVKKRETFNPKARSP